MHDAYAQRELRRVVHGECRNGKRNHDREDWRKNENAEGVGVELGGMRAREDSEREELSKKMQPKPECSAL